jgi:hypothetical protein
MSVQPITKLRLFREARRYVLDLMERDTITPERADEILGYVSTYVVDLDTPEAVRAFAAHLAEKFVELRRVQMKFLREEQEEIDGILKAFVEEVFGTGDMVLASEVMQQVTALEGDMPNCLKTLQERYPNVYEIALRNVA